MSAPGYLVIILDIIWTLNRLSRLYSGADPVLVEGDCFEAFVPVPDMVNGLGAGGANDAKTLDTTYAEIRAAVGRLLECYGSFPASQLVHEATSVGERTVRRYLSKMVNDGKLRAIAGGRSTRYAADGKAMTPWRRSSLEGSVVGKDV